MKHTEKCSVPGCTFETTHQSVAVARRVVGNHKRRVHGIIGASASAQWKAKNQTARISERPPEPTAEAPPQVSPNFCPNCGCNLAAIKAALNLRRRA